VVGAIVGDFIAAENGIGRLLLAANGNMDTELLFAAILALVGAGIVLFLLMEGAEKLALPWHISQRTPESTTWGVSTTPQSPQRSETPRHSRGAPREPIASRKDRS